MTVSGQGDGIMSNRQGIPVFETEVSMTGTIVRAVALFVFVPRRTRRHSAHT